MQHGKLSAKIGKKIIESIRRSGRDDLSVYFDSGEKSEGTKLPLYHGRPDQFVAQNILGEMDIVIAHNYSGRILVMCKFGAEGAESCRVLGDMTAVAASDNLRIKGRDYDMETALCLIGYRCEETKQEGYGMAQRRLDSVGTRFQTILNEGSRRSIEYALIARKDYDKIFEEMQRVICRHIGVEQC